MVLSQPGFTVYHWTVCVNSARISVWEKGVCVWVCVSVKGRKEKERKGEGWMKAHFYCTLPLWVRVLQCCSQGINFVWEMAVEAVQHRQLWSTYAEHHPFPPFYNQGAEGRRCSLCFPFFPPLFFLPTCVGAMGKKRAPAAETCLPLIRARQDSSVRR